MPNNVTPIGAAKKRNNQRVMTMALLNAVKQGDLEFDIQPTPQGLFDVTIYGSIGPAYAHLHPAKTRTTISHCTVSLEAGVLSA